MKIFEEKGKIRLQLMDIKTKTMLFDFVVPKRSFEELRDHIIKHLANFDLYPKNKPNAIQFTHKPTTI